MGSGMVCGEGVVTMDRVSGIMAGRQEGRDPEVQDVENWPKLRTQRWGLGELCAAV
jgi:hypothetical protein